jgi:hypothetical protein
MAKVCMFDRVRRDTVLCAILRGDDPVSPYDCHYCSQMRSHWQKASVASCANVDVLSDLQRSFELMNTTISCTFADAHSQDEQDTSNKL